jgi:hypothetical protein
VSGTLYYRVDAGTASATSGVKVIAGGSFDINTQNELTNFRVLGVSAEVEILLFS